MKFHPPRGSRATGSLILATVLLVSSMVPALAQVQTNPGLCPAGYDKIDYSGSLTWQSDGDYATVILVGGPPPGAEENNDDPDGRDKHFSDVDAGDILAREAHNISHICVLPHGDEQQTPVCEEGTKHAGTPIDEVEDCDPDEQQTPVCEEGTKHAGTPIDEVEDCDPDEQQTVDTCPNLEGTQTDVPEGMEFDDDGNCVETTEVSDDTQTRENEGDDEATPVVETAVLGVTLQQTAGDTDELPETGASSLLHLVLAGLLSLGLGGVMLRRRDETA
jgi:LPXTG-motif cell wall-anchored protein